VDKRPNVKIMEYGIPEKRNKGKDKRRENKKHPYKLGGTERTMYKQINRKNCPVCDSSRVVIGPTSFSCSKCGYINKQNE